MGQYTLNYKTFDQLLSEVKMDFEAYNLEDMIKPQQLIKVAKRITYDLGLRIYQTKNEVLEVEKGRAKLPNNFLILNYAYLLGNFESTQAVPQGTWTEQVPLAAPTYFPGVDKIDICAVAPTCPTPEPECPDPCQSPEPCGCSTCGCDTWINCKGEEMQLIQKINKVTRNWNEFYRMTIKGDDQLFDPSCPNTRWQTANTGVIRDGYIYTGFKTGNIYLNYQGMMEDKEGNLLVLDHDMINEYYEYALKKRIIEILLGNGVVVQGAFIQLIHTEYRIARNYAKSIVNTPDFSELKEVWAMNRKALFNKYYKMFT
jgi:hypothetical protein